MVKYLKNINMEKEVFNTKYVVATYDDQAKIYHAKLLPETENMRDEEWKELIKSHLKVIEKFRPKYYIDDNTYRLYSYPPDIQAWTLELCVESWNKNGLKKYVQILPENIIGQITANQIGELANTEFSLLFENKFVKCYKEAIEWINE
jgi:hypothetical protein